MNKTALIAGSTGLIGKQLLSLLMSSKKYDKVIAITRKPHHIKDDKLQNVVVNFDELEKHQDQLKADDIFCCLGTTMKKAGTKEKFRRVDFDYPLDLAKISVANGGKQFHLISALGADKKSTVFYNKVKGEIEEEIQKLAFDHIHIYRPSLLIGKREEERVGEDAAKTFYKIFSFIFIGPLKKYKAIDSSKVAQAMILQADTHKSGVHIHESIEMQKV